MKRSTERILTTHLGSLARPDALMQILRSKDRGQPYDHEAYARLVRETVADVVRKHSLDVGPRVFDMELKDIVDVLLGINAGAYSFEAANPAARARVPRVRAGPAARGQDPRSRGGCSS